MVVGVVELHIPVLGDVNSRSEIDIDIFVPEVVGIGSAYLV